MTDRRVRELVATLRPAAHARLQRSAKKNRRSISDEIVEAIETHLRNGTILQHLDERLRRVEGMVTKHQGQFVTMSHLVLSLAKKG